MKKNKKKIQKNQNLDNITNSIHFDSNTFKDYIKNEILLDSREIIDQKIKEKVNLHLVIIGLFVTILGLLAAAVTYLGTDSFAFKIEKKYANRVKDRIEDINIQYSKKIEAIIKEHKEKLSDHLIKSSSIMSVVQLKYEEIKDQLLIKELEPQERKNEISSILSQRVKDEFDRKTYYFYLKKGKNEYKNSDISCIESFKNALEYYPNQYEAFYWLALSNKNISRNKSETIKYLESSILSGFNDIQRALDDNFENYIGKDNFQKLFKNN